MVHGMWALLSPITFPSGSSLSYGTPRPLLPFYRTGTNLPTLSSGSGGSLPRKLILLEHMRWTSSPASRRSRRRRTMSQRPRISSRGFGVRSCENVDVLVCLSIVYRSGLVSDRVDGGCLDGLWDGMKEPQIYPVICPGGFLIEG